MNIIRALKSDPPHPFQKGQIKKDIFSSNSRQERQTVPGLWVTPLWQEVHQDQNLTPQMLLASSTRPDLTLSPLPLHVTLTLHLQTSCVTSTLSLTQQLLDFLHI